MLAEVCGAQIKFYIPPCSACSGHGCLIRSACKGAGSYNPRHRRAEFYESMRRVMKFRAARCELNLRDDYMPLRARKLNCTTRARCLIVARD